MKRLMKGLGTALPIAVALLGASSVLYPPLYGTVLGTAFEAWWQYVDGGQSPLECGGSMRMTVRGVKIRAKLEGAFPDELISAGGDCHIEILDSDLQAPKVVSAGGDARVIIKGGHLGGKEAISAGGDAIVEVQGTAIDGEVSGQAKQLVGVAPGKYGSAAPPAPPPAAPAVQSGQASAARSP